MILVPAVALAAVAPVALLGSAGPASAGSTPAPPTTAPQGPPPAKAGILVDLDTGRVLVDDNAHQLLPPASLTKILTALVAADWITPGTQVPVSARAMNVAPDKLGMKTGQDWPFDIAMHALLISSSNDAAYALAEEASGSVESFAATMTKAAAEIGIDDHPVLRDPAGLDGTEGVGGGNLMSAWDVAVAARDLLANPYLASIVGMKTDRFTGPDGIVYEIASHNLAFLNSYPGATGVKTGYTVPAGVCIAASASRSGRNMLAVVMNGVSPDRTAEMLLDQGFNTPVQSEPASDATLPPIAEPEPPAPPPPDSFAGESVRDAAGRVAAAAGGGGPARGAAVTPAILAGASLVTVLASAAWLVSRGRRRQAEEGLHFRRPPGPISRR